MLEKLMGRSIVKK